MFSLIITVISIALVGALALATLYFGGDAFNEGSTKAVAASVVNQASQISGANTMYYVDEQGYAATIADLVTGKYLGSEPKPNTAAGGSFSLEVVSTVATGAILLDDLSERECKAVNQQAGKASPETAYTDATAVKADGQFGCYGNSTDGFTFYFK